MSEDDGALYTVLDPSELAANQTLAICPTVKAPGAGKAKCSLFNLDGFARLRFRPQREIGGRRARRRPIAVKALQINRLLAVNRHGDVRRPSPTGRDRGHGAPL
jgi:hypothetical protein